MSAKERIRQFFLANIGTVVSSTQIRDASGANGGITEWARRVRELRDEEGWPILSHNDSAALKPGEYLLKKDGPKFPSGRSGDCLLSNKGLAHESRISITIYPAILQ